MSIDLAKESTLSLTQAATLLPPGRRGRRPTMSCILRWVIDGVKTPHGVIRLEAVRLGGRWLTSAEALQRFAERQTPRLECAATPVQATAGRRRATERAEKELDRIGI